jgi:hypothetical protein
MWSSRSQVDCFGSALLGNIGHGSGKAEHGAMGPGAGTAAQLRRTCAPFDWDRSAWVFGAAYAGASIAPTLVTFNGGKPLTCRG